MRAVDANVIVRLVIRDDPKQVVAAESFVAKGAWVSLLVLAEVIRVLDAVYDLGRQKIATAVEMLLCHKDLTIQDADVVERGDCTLSSSLQDRRQLQPNLAPNRPG